MRFNALVRLFILIAKHQLGVPDASQRTWLRLGGSYRDSRACPGCESLVGVESAGLGGGVEPEAGDRLGPSESVLAHAVRHAVYLRKLPTRPESRDGGDAQAEDCI